MYVEELQDTTEFNHDIESQRIEVVLNFELDIRRRFRHSQEQAPVRDCAA